MGIGRNELILNPLKTKKSVDKSNKKTKLSNIKNLEELKKFIEDELL